MIVLSIPDRQAILHLAYQISEHFGLPREAIFSRTAFAPMSEQLYRTSA